jgi:hypothetical protein
MEKRGAWKERERKEEGKRGHTKARLLLCDREGGISHSNLGLQRHDVHSILDWFERSECDIFYAGLGWNDTSFSLWELWCIVGYSPCNFDIGCIELELCCTQSF